uniref:ABC transporter family G domain-containing protein n=1 Tax=Physcomitrium patens TaxID=3218 RepID=A0A2K1J1W6_PHYPA|nr:hypothetical protein PHYPA_023424 [Physcomitrium patens]
MHSQGTYPVYFLDEISTGLDSSATYDIVSAFRTMARMRRYTCLFSLLQPAPEVFNLFDRVIIMHEGRIIYQGPREDVLVYFAKLGYVTEIFAGYAQLHTLTNILCTSYFILGTYVSVGFSDMGMMSLFLPNLFHIRTTVIVFH